jgi:hypothetical protein
LGFIFTSFSIELKENLSQPQILRNEVEESAGASEKHFLALVELSL